MEPISARQAATLLAGSGLSRSQSRRLLATGIAGRPLRTPSTHLYDARRVRALADWPSVLGVAALVQLRLAASRYGCLPVVITISSFVIATYETTEAHRTADGDGVVRLRPAGAWADAFREHRLYSPAGNQWTLRTPELVPDPG